MDIEIGKIYNLVYKNRFNEVKGYSVEVLSMSEDIISVWDINSDIYKSFMYENILGITNTFEEAVTISQVLQKDYEIRVRTHGVPRANREGKLEICFTGFKSKDKKELEQIAVKNGLFLRTKITNDLGLLVCGYNAGPMKVKEALSKGISIVAGKEGFLNFLESGEIHD